MPITSSSETFANFVEDWLLRHRQLIQQLTDETTTLTSVEEESLVSNFLSHFLQYNQDKSSAVSVARDDIYDFFSPSWLSSYEKLIFLVGGFKPGMVFKLIKTSVKDLTRQQEDQLENIKKETKRKEKDLMRRFALLQQSVADPLLMVPLRRVGGKAGPEGKQDKPMLVAHYK